MDLLLIIVLLLFLTAEIFHKLDGILCKDILLYISTSFYFLFILGFLGIIIYGLFLLFFH